MTSVIPQPIDLTNWVLETYIFDPGYPKTNWVLSGSNTAIQTANGNPSFFCSPDLDAFNTAFEGKISVQQNDQTDIVGDYIGFAIGFNPGQNGEEDGDSQNLNADFLLLDWKQGDQQYDYDGCPSGDLVAQGGLALSRVTGVPANAEVWYHTDIINCAPSNGGVEELARGLTLGNKGWEKFVEYDFKFEYTESEIKVFVNDVLEIFLTASPENPFPPGSFCFYNYSVASVQYRGFTEQFVTSAPSSMPSSSPTREPTTQVPTKQPTNAPTPQPTKQPTNAPTPQPTKQPTQAETPQPTPQPIQAETPQPTKQPTKQPSPAPFIPPSPAPIDDPTPTPTVSPSRKPSKKPTSMPTLKPTSVTTTSPTDKPTDMPTNSQTTEQPTTKPTPQPSLPPILNPVPTLHPTKKPTHGPPNGPLCPAEDNCNWFGFKGVELHNEIFGFCASKCIISFLVQLFIGLLGYECDSTANKDTCIVDDIF